MNVGVDVHTDNKVPVELVVVKGDEGWTSLIFADDITGFGMWRQTGDDTWYNASIVKLRQMVRVIDMNVDGAGR